MDNKQKELIEKNVVALASANKQGEPHCVAAAYPHVVSDNQIVLTANFMVETLQNISENNKVSLIVWSTAWTDIDNCYGYEFRGTAEYFDSGRWKDFVASKPENKDLPAKGALMITVDKIKELQ